MYVCMYVCTVVTAVLKAVSLSGGHTVATELPTSMGIKQGSSLRLTMYVEINYAMENSERNKIIKVYYRGQPYWCRNCSKQHMEKCPKLPKRMTPHEKINREKEVKTLMVLDSQARMVNQDSLNADVIAVPGAKLGHLANSIAWNNKIVKYDNILLYTD